MSNKESLKNVYDILKYPSILLLLSTVALGAFSRESRKKILERDGYRSIESGESNNLEAAHIDHTRGRNYNDPENGMTLTRYEHFKDHVRRAGKNGLTQSQNEWAIHSIWMRMTDEERQRALKEGFRDPTEVAV